MSAAWAPCPATPVAGRRGSALGRALRKICPVIDVAGNLRRNETDRGVGIGLAEQVLAFEAVSRRIGKAVEADRAGGEEVGLFGELFLGGLVHLPALLDLVHQLVLLTLLVLLLVGTGLLLTNIMLLWYVLLNQEITL